MHAKPEDWRLLTLSGVICVVLFSFVLHISGTLGHWIWQVGNVGITVLHAAPKNAQSTKPVPAAEQAVYDFDLLNMTPEKFEVLLSLIHRGKDIHDQHEALRRKEEKLVTLKEVTDQKLGQLEKTSKKLEKMLAKRREQSEADVAHLSKMFESMKPQEAAAIISEMPAHIILSVMKKTKNQKAAAILASMPPQQAAQIAAVLGNMANTLRGGS